MAWAESAFEQTDSSIAKIEAGDTITYYDSVSEAVTKAQNGQTITILKSVDLENDRVDVVDKSITLDLNGCTLNKSKGNATIYVHAATDGSINGKVTITDSSADNSGKITGLDCVLWIQGGTIELQKGTVECLGYWEYPDNSGTLWGNTAVEIKGSTTDTANYSNFIMDKDAVINSVESVGDSSVGTGYVMIDNNSGAAYGTNMEINGTINHAILYVNGNITPIAGNIPTIKVNETAVVDGGIYAAGYAKWDINGAAISGSTGIEIRAGELNVTGDAKITGTEQPATVTPNGNGGTTLGAGIAVAQHTTKLPVKVNIQNGTIKGFSALYQSNPQSNEQNAIDLVSILVEDGKFEAINEGTVSVYSENLIGFITGGIL